MDWWYKSKKHRVSPDTIFSLQDSIKNVLREGQSLAKINLYNDHRFFYVKTTNRIVLNYFLSQNGFEEMEEDPKAGLTLLFGAE